MPSLVKKLIKQETPWQILAYLWLAYGVKILFIQMSIIHSSNGSLAYSWWSEKWRVSFSILLSSTSSLILGHSQTALQSLVYPQLWYYFPLMFLKLKHTIPIVLPTGKLKNFWSCHFHWWAGKAAYCFGFGFFVLFLSHDLWQIPLSVIQIFLPWLISSYLQLNIWLWKFLNTWQAYLMKVSELQHTTGPTFLHFALSELFSDFTCKKSHVCLHWETVFPINSKTSLSLPLPKF